MPHLQIRTLRHREFKSLVETHLVVFANSLLIIITCFYPTNNIATKIDFPSFPLACLFSLHDILPVPPFAEMQFLFFPPIKLPVVPLRPRLSDPWVLTLPRSYKLEITYSFLKFPHSAVKFIKTPLIGRYFYFGNLNVWNLPY